MLVIMVQRTVHIIRSAALDFDLDGGVVNAISLFQHLYCFPQDLLCTLGADGGLAA